MLDIHQRSELTKKYFEKAKKEDGPGEEFKITAEAKTTLSRFLISPMYDFFLLFLMSEKETVKNEILQAVTSSSAAVDHQRELNILGGQIKGIDRLINQFEAWKKGLSVEIAAAEKNKKSQEEKNGQKKDGS